MKKKAFLKFISILLTGLIFINSNSAYLNISGTGIDFDEKIRELEEKIEKINEANEKRETQILEYKNDINKQKEFQGLVSTQIDEIKAKVDMQVELIEQQQNLVDNQIKAINNLENDIKQLEQDIVDTEFEIERLRNENAENLKNFGQIMRSMYMNDDYDTISLLMGSSDFFDLLVRSEIMQNVGEKNNEFMQGLLNDIEKQESLIVSLEENIVDKEAKIVKAEDDKAKLENYKKELETKRAELETELQDEYSKYYDISADIEDLNDSVSSLQVKIKKEIADGESINKEIEELIRAKARAEAGDGPIYSSDEFIWPVDSIFKGITTYFGYDAWRGGNHYGIDVSGDGSGYTIGGRNIYAAQSGTVTLAFNNGAYNGGFGNYVILDHGGGVSTVYAHASSVTVSKGQYIEQGEIIGYVGKTGWATGNHLHFEVRVDGTAVNPLNYKYHYLF